jgi:hypothetical protein
VVHTQAAIVTAGLCPGVFRGLGIGVSRLINHGSGGVKPKKLIKSQPNFPVCKKLVFFWRLRFDVLKSDKESGFRKTGAGSGTLWPVAE